MKENENTFIDERWPFKNNGKDSGDNHNLFLPSQGDSLLFRAKPALHTHL